MKVAAILLAVGMGVVLALAQVSFLTGLLLILFLVGFPAMAIAQVEHLRSRVVPRVAVYRSSIGAISLVGLAGLGVGSMELGTEGLGLIAFDPVRDLLWTAAMTAAGLALLKGSYLLAHRLGMPDDPLMRWILPQSRSERRHFFVLSFAAGFGEELAYRGFLLLMLVGLTGSPAVALVLSSLAFGLVHAYQGKLGIVVTALIGVVFGLAVLQTGALLPVMLAHTLIDLIAGLWVPEAFLGPDPDRGTPDPITT